jgi:phospholipase C
MTLNRLGRIVLTMLLLASCLLTLGVTPVQKSVAAPYSSPINHFVVIYLENRSFDSIYGNFPGANGLANAGAAATQVDKDGKPYDKLPPIMNTNLKPAAVDTRFPTDLPNKPFSIDKYVAANQTTGDLVHRYYQNQVQIDGGKNDKFAAISDAGGLTMGYYDGSTLPLWQYAKNYTLADNFFTGAFGGSFLNHMFLVCACAPKWENAPTNIVIKLDASGNLVTDGQVTPEWYAVNTSYTINSPHPATITNTNLLMPQLTMPTIGDRLSDKNITWAYYSGGWNDAIAGKPDPLFQFHHQPFAYFKNYADGTSGRAQHLKDKTDFLSDIKNGTLPAVSFYKPIGSENEHPGYADILTGEQKTAEILQAIQNSPNWKDTAVIITYDENGGLWDHAAPPKVDQWGPGTRIPAIIISPYAKKGFVDHTQYDTTSILKFIETRYDLQPLGTRDAGVSDLNNAFDFSQKPAASGGQGGGNVPAAPSTGQGGTQPADQGNGSLLLLIPLVVVLFGTSYLLVTFRRRKKAQ